MERNKNTNTYTTRSKRSRTAQTKDSKRRTRVHRQTGRTTRPHNPRTKTKRGGPVIQVVKKILAAHGINSIEDMEIGELYEAEGLGMDLTIEKIGEHEISVAHYYTQRGDLMSDPEIVFHIDDGDWIPISYTQHPRIHKHNTDGLPGVANFADRWDRSLRKQGYIPDHDNKEVKA